MRVMLFVLLISVLVFNTNCKSNAEKYFYNRNSISDFEIVNDDIIALTTSGNILRFDENFNLTGEIIDTVAFSCLGSVTEERILVGRKDGKIYSLSTKNLNFEKIGNIEQVALFITNCKNGEILIKFDVLN